MGYACPVCETPQRDGEHLAHHLAFTAMLHGDDHEAWLDERVPDWSDRDPDGLAAEVTSHADDTQYHEVFEDTVDRGRPDVDVGDHDHAGRGGIGHGRGAPDAHAHSTGGLDESGATDPETEAALREAREMTREMLAEDDEVDDNDDSGGDDAPDDPSA